MYNMLKSFLIEEIKSYKMYNVFAISPTQNKLLKWRFRPPFFTQHPDTSTWTTENLATLVGINEAQLNYMLEVR